jgi:carbon-monoxide dehydrogenase medium subunit
MAEYFFPTSIEEAVQCLQSHDGGALVIAGGTDVMADIRKKKLAPQCLVDITRIPDLDRIEVADETIKIGAAVTFEMLKDSSFLQRHVHALPDAARSVGAIGIQTAATWVGNIVQAMPAADGAIIALALDAEACIVDDRGARWRAIESLFEGPGSSAVDPSRQLITHIRFPHAQTAWGTAWKRIGRRPSLVLPILNCAVKLCLDADSFDKRATGDPFITDATIALGPVAPRPFRAREAEGFLRGKPATTDVFAQAGSIVQRESNPRSSIMRASREYRLAVIPALIRAALMDAAQRAKEPWRDT